MEIKNPILRAEVDNWLARQNEALRAAEAAVQRAQYCERQLDRLLDMAGVQRPEKPQLYVIQGGSDAS